jgi:hypothetical protein
MPLKVMDMAELRLQVIQPGDRKPDRPHSGLFRHRRKPFLGYRRYRAAVRPGPGQIRRTALRQLAGRHPRYQGRLFLCDPDGIEETALPPWKGQTFRFG